MSPPEYIIKE